MDVTYLELNLVLTSRCTRLVQSELKISNDFHCKIIPFFNFELSSTNTFVRIQASESISSRNKRVFSCMSTKQLCCNTLWVVLWLTPVSGIAVRILGADFEGSFWENLFMHLSAHIVGFLDLLIFGTNLFGLQFLPSKKVFSLILCRLRYLLQNEC